MASSVRRNYLILNYLVLIVNNVLLIMGLGVVGLSANTLYWAGDSKESNTTYVLNPTALPQIGAPASSNINQYPTGFRLLGTEFALAAGVPVVVVAAMTIALMFVFSLRPVQHGFPIPNYAFRFSVLIHTSFISAVFSAATVTISWLEYYTTPALVFTSSTISNSTYNLATQTPETWLLQISRSILGEENKKPLHNLSILATAARIILIPTLAFQAISLLAMLMLRKRMKTNAGPLKRKLHMEKLRESLLEQAYAERNSSRMSGPVLKNPADEYTGMVREMAETTRVWRMDAYVRHEPGYVEEIVDSPVTMEAAEEREGRTRLMPPPPPPPEWDEDMPPAIPPRSERRNTDSRDREVGRTRQLQREVTEKTGLVHGERDIAEMSRYDGWEMADDLRAHESENDTAEYRYRNGRDWR